MTQVIEKPVLENEIMEIGPKSSQKVNERECDALIGDQTPKYRERVMTSQQAKQKLWAKYGTRPSI